MGAKHSARRRDCLGAGRGGRPGLLGSTLTRHDTINEDELRQRLSRMGTIDLRVDYLRPGRGNRFTATASLLRAGNKVAVARVELHNEEQLYIASATATYMVG